ncbi:MAG TPA: hypothetical protein VKX17_03235 [Planctomycetota bacterium]|nr:hypothetical protein [Planctomycetota bacterium]
MKSLFHLLILPCALAALGGFALDTPETKPAPTAASDAPKAQPVFPLKTPAISEIRDGFEDYDEDGNLAALHYVDEAARDVVAALNASSMEHMRASIDPELRAMGPDKAFKRIFNHAADYRGHVVDFEGTLQYIHDKPEHVELDGKTIPLVCGHLDSSYQVLTYMSIEPLRAGMKVGDPVRITGVFLQRFAYLSRQMPGQKLAWTPLIIVKKVEPIVVAEEPPPKTAWVIGYILFGGIALVLVLAGISKRRDLVARRNIFTRMKRNRDNDGKDRLFPKTGGKK